MGSRIKILGRKMESAIDPYWLSYSNLYLWKICKFLQNLPNSHIHQKANLFSHFRFNRVKVGVSNSEHWPPSQRFRPRLSNKVCVPWWAPSQPIFVHFSHFSIFNKNHIPDGERMKKIRQSVRTRLFLDVCRCACQFFRDFSIFSHLFTTAKTNCRFYISRFPFSDNFANYPTRQLYISLLRSWKVVTALKSWRQTVNIIKVEWPASSVRFYEFLENLKRILKILFGFSLKLKHVTVIQHSTTIKLLFRPEALCKWVY